MSSEKTLKPCPFCGGDARYEQDLRLMNASENSPKWFVICKQCTVRTPTATIPQVQAIWNNRVKIVPREVEALKQEPTYTSQIAQKAYEDGKKDGYVQAKLEQEPFINKPCVSSGVCEHDKNKVLGKIRAEIEQLDTKRIEIHRTYHTIEREVIQKDRVLEILDKYKAESEE